MNKYDAALAAAQRAHEAAIAVVEACPDPGDATTDNQRKEQAEDLRLAEARKTDVWMVRSLVEHTVKTLERWQAQRAALVSARTVLRRQRGEAQEALDKAKAAHPRDEQSWVRETRAVAGLEQVLAMLATGWGGYTVPALLAALPPGFDSDGLRHLSAVEQQIAEQEAKLAEQLAKLPPMEDTKAA